MSDYAEFTNMIGLADFLSDSRAELVDGPGSARVVSRLLFDPDVTTGSGNSVLHVRDDWYCRSQVFRPERGRPRHVYEVVSAEGSHRATDPWNFGDDTTLPAGEVVLATAGVELRRFVRLIALLVDVAGIGFAAARVDLGRPTAVGLPSTKRADVALSVDMPSDLRQIVRVRAFNDLARSQVPEQCDADSAQHSCCCGDDDLDHDLRGLSPLAGRWAHASVRPAFPLVRTKTRPVDRKGAT
jgi:hypothetical protein